MDSDQEKQRQEKRVLLATAIASMPATVVAKYVTHPIDTIKAKVQVSRLQMRKVTDFKFGQALQLVRTTWAEEGIKGFYRGATISTFGSIFAFSCYMSAYQHTKTVLSKYQFFQQYLFFSHFIAGFAAEMGSCILWLPIDIIKERMQVQAQVKIYHYNSPLEAAKKIQRSEGLIGLYRAFGATLTFFGPFSAIFFMAFEQLKKWIVSGNTPTLLESIMSSSGASAFAGFLTTPLQMVKLRMQIQRADVAQSGGKLQDSIFGYRNIFHGLWLLYKNEGFYSLYKGAVLRVCYVVPITSLSMSLNEKFKQQLLERKQLDWLL